MFTVIINKKSSATKFFMENSVKKLSMKTLGHFEKRITQ